MAKRLAPGVWQLVLGWRPPLATNAYVIDDGEVTLVDAGFPLNARRLRDELDEVGITVADIDRVLLTHYDLDHVGGLSRLASELAAPAYLGEPDLSLARGTWNPPWLHHKGLFHRGLRQVYRLPAAVEFRSTTHGDVIGGFTAFHTPGHNPGHTVYVHEGLGVALLGDLVWSKPHGLVTPLWIDSYDLEALRMSIRAFAEQAPPFEIAAMGHGTPLRRNGRGAVRDLAARW